MPRVDVVVSLANVLSRPELFTPAQQNGNPIGLPELRLARTAEEVRKRTLQSGQVKASAACVVAWFVSVNSLYSSLQSAGTVPSGNPGGEPVRAPGCVANSDPPPPGREPRAARFALPRQI